MAGDLYYRLNVDFTTSFSIVQPVSSDPYSAWYKNMAAGCVNDIIYGYYDYKTALYDCGMQQSGLATLNYKAVSAPPHCAEPGHG